MPVLDVTPAAARPRVLYVVTEDWFFCSHFLPMARAARDIGFDVAIATRVRAHGEAITREGFRLVPVEAERRSLNPLAVVAAFRRLVAVIKAEQPEIVHLIALRSILIGGIAARLAGIQRRVVALTGLGFIGAGRGPVAELARAGLKLAIRLLVHGAGVRYLFENRSDPVLLGLDPRDAERVTIVGGAGVDPVALVPTPLPPQPPVRVAMVARMLWSKGVDLAVEAVKRARAAGADVTLSLYGAPDTSNPRAISEGMLRGWSQEPGIDWLGPTRDVAGVWQAHHIAILPSRGGEGLPRTILEAAACGRAILTSDVPGCRDFVRDGIEGRVVANESAEALTAALLEMARDPARVAEMGAAARRRVLDGHTETAVGQAVAALYQDMMV